MVKNGEKGIIKQIESINVDFSYKYPFESDEDYQQCFLSVFGINEFNEKKIAEKTKALYEEMKYEAGFNELLQYLAGQLMTDDKEIGLYILFSFDYIHDFLELLKKNENDNENKYFFYYLEKIMKNKNKQINI